MDSKIGRTIVFFCLAAILPFGAPQFSMRSGDSTGVLASIRDNVYGTGAGGVRCTLFKLEPDAVSSKFGNWTAVESKRAGGGGGAYFSIGDPIGTNYKFQAEIEGYYAAKNLTTFYPYAEIVFEKLDTNTLLIPIMISPYSYSAYRGRMG